LQLVWRAGDLEIEKGLEHAMPMFDRNQTGATADQDGFFKFVVNPLLDLWVGHFPACKAIRDQAGVNLAGWKG